MFEKFSVIDLIKTRSASVCTFAGNVVKFNVQTAQELRFPEYIQFLIEPKSKQFAIRACKEDAPNAVRFSKPEDEQKAQIKISNATVVDIRSLDWLVRCGNFSRNRCRRKACTETLTPKRHIACL